MLAGIRIACLMLSLISQGCSQYARISQTDINPATHEESRTVGLPLWGFSMAYVTPMNCEGNGLAEVMIERTFSDRILSFLTLSLYTPMELSWKCAKDKPMIKSVS